MWSALGNASGRDAVLLAGLVILGLAIAGKAWTTDNSGSHMAYAASIYRRHATLFVLFGLLILGSREFYAPFAPSLATLVASVQRSTLNARDAELQHKGYYEKLDNTSRMSANLWNITATKPSHWIPLRDTSIFRDLGSAFGNASLKANASINFMDQTLSTNSWGMRDRERALAKPSNVYRIAVLGPSHVMGSGVADHETVSRLLEELLNRKMVGVRFEVLNFGIAGIALTHQLAILAENVLRFDPDAVFFVDGSGVHGPASNHVLRHVALPAEIPFRRLQRLMKETGVTKLGDNGTPILFDGGRAVLETVGFKTRMPWVEAEQRLNRSSEELISLTFQEMSEIVTKHKAVPVFVGLNIVHAPPDGPVSVLRNAANAGMVVFDLFSLWQGQDMVSLRIHASDNHPNVYGNQLIAARLFELIDQHREELRLSAARRIPS